jgi:hypothetical protein
MPYGTIKVDNIIFTNGGSDQTVTVSGIVASTSGNLTVTGTISGGTVVAPYGSFTSLTGVTTSGTNANFQTITGAVGVYTTSVSGRAVNALTANIVSGVFASGTAAAPSITFTGNTAAGIYSPGTDQVAISTNGTGRLFVDSSGRVIIGASTAAIGNPLEVVGNSSSMAIGVRGRSADNIGVIGFYPNASSTESARIQSNGDSTLIFGTGSAGTERMRLTSAGLLGLGTSSPARKLVVSNSGAEGLEIGPGESANLNLQLHYNRSGSAYVTNKIDAADHLFFTSATERVRVTSGGLVGIGTSSPAKLLHVQSGSVTGAARGGAFTKTLFESSDATATYWELQAASTATNDFLFSKGNTGSYGVVGYDHVNDALRFFANSSERLRIDSSGRVGIGTSSPSYLLDLSGSASIGIRYKNTGTYGGIILDNSSATGGGYVSAFQNGTQRALFGVSGAIEGNTTSDCALSGDTGSNIRFYTNGSANEKMRLDTSGRLGIGTTSPAVTLDVTGGHSVLRTGLTVQGQSNLATGANLELAYDLIGDRAFIQAFNRTTSAYKPMRVIGSEIQFDISNSEKARIDSSGRLLVGTSTARANFFNTAGSAPQQLQVEGTSGNTCSLSSICSVADTSGGRLLLAHQRSGAVGGNTILNNGDQAGYITFQGNDGGEFVECASIEAIVDGTPGANDMPGRLVFSTTADGASSPTERVRINNTGSVTLLGATSVVSGTHSFQDNGSSPNTVRLYNNTDSNNATNHFLICDAAASVVRATIRSNGGIANFSANNVNLSDRNAKKDITLAIGTWDCLKEWEIVNFRYKDQPNDADLNLGVIAQQVAKSCPEVITVFQEAKEATETEPAQEERLGVKDQQVMWMAIKALQEAMNRIEVLETEVAALKGA